MTRQTIGISLELQQYIYDNYSRENDIQKDLRSQTLKMPEGKMQISPDQGQYMAFLVKLLNVKSYLEIGTFTGYSALCVAQAMKEGGKIIALDRNAEWTKIAKKYWSLANVEHMIDLKIGLAKDYLEGFIAEARQFDLIFIDADKNNYDLYYEQCLNLLSPNGLLLIDNVLWDGSVIDETIQNSQTNAIRALNKKLGQDPRIDVSLVPIGDGLTMVRKTDKNI